MFRTMSFGRFERTKDFRVNSVAFLVVWFDSLVSVFDWSSNPVWVSAKASDSLVSAFDVTAASAACFEAFALTVVASAAMRVASTPKRAISAWFLIARRVLRAMDAAMPAAMNRPNSTKFLARKLFAKSDPFSYRMGLSSAWRMVDLR